MPQSVKKSFLLPEKLVPEKNWLILPLGCEEDEFSKMVAILPSLLFGKELSRVQNVNLCN